MLTSFHRLQRYIQFFTWAFSILSFSFLHVPNNEFSTSRNLNGDDGSPLSISHFFRPALPVLWFFIGKRTILISLTTEKVVSLTFGRREDAPRLKSLHYSRPLTRDSKCSALGFHYISDLRSKRRCTSA